MRKPYLDNIRWAVVVLVILYHVCFLFNGVGCLGGIPAARSIPFFDAAMYVVYPWFMVLLFMIGGMSARYALQKCTDKQFIRKRVRKLLIPSTLGLFVLHWITGYLNLKISGSLSFIPPILWYPISAISGIGPLWFIQMLFLFSCILVLIRKLDKFDRIWKVCGRTFLNKETSFTKYMSRSSFGLFIIHYPVLLIICYILHYDCNFAPIWNYAIAVIGGFAVTFALYEMLKRIPLIRYLVLGIKA